MCRVRNRKEKRQALFALLFMPLLTQCTFVDHLAEKWNVRIQIGETFSIGEVQAPRPAMPVTPKPVQTAGFAPAPAAAQEPSWGTCEPMQELGVLANVARATVEVKEIRLGRKGFTDAEASVIPVSRELNLLQLARSLSALLTELELPAGEYNEIRLITEKAEMENRRGQRFSLRIPEGDRQGIRITLDRDLSVQPDEAMRITLSFCTERNFQRVPAPPDANEAGPHFAFHPTINRVVNLSL